MQAPSVSIVIPAYNQLAFLKETVTSVQQQTVKDWELLIIDDASSDGTWAWLQQIQDRRIRVFHNPQNLERVATRNRGLQEARGEFIMFLDHDDLLRPTALEKLEKALSSNPKLVGAYGARMMFGERGYTIRELHPRFSFTKRIWADILFGCPAAPSQCLYRTEIVRAVGGWRREATQVEDRDLWVRVALRGPARILPEIVVDYRWHKQQASYSPPDNIEEIKQSIAESFIQSLPAEQKTQAERIATSSRIFWQAEHFHREQNYGKAFRCHVKACQIAPELLLSPLASLYLTRGVMKSLSRLLLSFKW